MRRAHGWVFLLGGFSLWAVGCGGGSPGPILKAGNGVIDLEIDQDTGAVNVLDKVHGVQVLGLHQAVLLDVDGTPRLATTLGRPMPCKEVKDPGASVSFSCQGDTGAGFVTQVGMVLPADSPHVFQLGVSFVNKSGAAIAVRKFHSFRLTRADDGALLVGGDPSSVRVLQNGSDEFIDFFVNLLPGEKPLSNPDQNALLNEYSSFSSGSAVAYDQSSGASVLAGFIDFDWAIPLVAMAGDKSVARPVGGRIPMTELIAEARYPWVAEVPAGKTISGGAAVLVLGEDTPFDALEEYAAQVAKRKAIVLPPAPYSGWDSWYTGSAKTDLSAPYIQASADGLAALFGAFGLSSMQLDEGWQDTWGDWDARDTFPQGMAASAAAIRADGLRPEIWIAPLDAREDSQVWAQHQGDWFRPKGSYGALLIPSDTHAFDLANPEVQNYVRKLGERIRGWGFESVKMDFAYYTLFSELPPDPKKTPVALYRNAVTTFRQAVGKDIYFINISMCFPNYGLVDAFRIGLDTWPCWNGGEQCPDRYPRVPGIGAQGVKPGIRMAARRYWMNGRIWWNHQDQVFFRDLSEEEARAFISLVALSGGMVSLGEDPLNITPAQADLYRKILPLTGLTARPLDLFAREFPEVWHLKTNQGGARVDIVGLFHWGENSDLTASPFADRPDGADVNQQVDLKTLGLDPAGDYLAYEFWTGEFLGEFTGTLSVQLSPHTARVYKLVAKPTAPTFLATNRHILMGPGIVQNLAWDLGGLKLTGTVQTAPGFTQTLVFFVPMGFTAQTAAVAGADQVSQEMKGDNLLVVTFSGQDAGSHSFGIDFSH